MNKNKPETETENVQTQPSSYSSSSSSYSSSSPLDYFRNPVQTPAYPDPNTGEVRMVKLNFPTDTQWIARQKSRVIKIQNFGRGHSQTSIETAPQVSLSIYNENRINQVDLDQEEAEILLDALSSCQIRDIHREGNQYVVSFSACAADFQCRLRIPTAKQVRQYESSSLIPRENRYGVQKYTPNIEPAGDLFDQLCPEFKALPIIFKSEILQAVIQEIRDQVEGAARPGPGAGPGASNQDPLLG